MVLTLYKMDASPPCRAIYMIIEALKIPDVEYVEVDLFAAENIKEEFLKMNPQHTIPVIKDGDFIVWDSHAIGAYLITKYGKDDSLYPTDPYKRAIVDQRLHFDSGILFPALRGCAEPIIVSGETSMRPENVEKIKKAYYFTEKFLTTDWMAGDDVTIADICCVANISSLNEMVPIYRNEYPNISAWLERCSQQEFYIKGNETQQLQFRAILKDKMG